MTDLMEDQNPESRLDAAYPYYSSVLEPKAPREHIKYMSDLLRDAHKIGLSTTGPDAEQDAVVAFADQWLNANAHIGYEELTQVLQLADAQDAVDWAWTNAYQELGFEEETYKADVRHGLSYLSPFNAFGDVIMAGWSVIGDPAWRTVTGKPQLGPMHHLERGWDILTSGDERLKGHDPNPYGDPLANITGVHNLTDAAWLAIDIIDAVSLKYGGAIIEPTKQYFRNAAARGRAARLAEQRIVQRRPAAPRDVAPEDLSEEYISQIVRNGGFTDGELYGPVSGGSDGPFIPITDPLEIWSYPLPVRKIISGGQTGGDEAGLYAGRDLGIETGGTAPAGWRTETGSNPDLRDFGLTEHHESSYPARTRKNVKDSDGTIYFDFHGSSAGLRVTRGEATRLGKEFLLINQGWIEKNGALDSLEGMTAVRAWLINKNIRDLNVAGNRQSSPPYDFDMFTNVRNWLNDILGEPPEELGFTGTRGNRYEVPRKLEVPEGVVTQQQHQRDLVGRVAEKRAARARENRIHDKPIQMNFVFGEGGTLPAAEHIKSSNTFDAIVAGERTATTRRGSQLNHVNVGDTVTFARGGDRVTVRVTGKRTLENETPEDWARREGYDPQAAADNWTEGKKFSEQTQIKFEVLDDAVGKVEAPVNVAFLQHAKVEHRRGVVDEFDVHEIDADIRAQEPSKTDPLIEPPLEPKPVDGWQDSHMKRGIRQHEGRLVKPQTRVMGVERGVRDDGTIDYGTYFYTDKMFQAEPLTPLIKEIKERVEEITGYDFDIVLAQRYQDGSTDLGWHSDLAQKWDAENNRAIREKGTKPESVVVSVNFGATRDFAFTNTKTGTPMPANQRVLRLGNGDVLIMMEGTNANYRHSILRADPNDVGLRINLTFRRLDPELQAVPRRVLADTTDITARISKLQAEQTELAQKASKSDSEKKRFLEIEKEIKDLIDTKIESKSIDPSVQDPSEIAAQIGRLEREKAEIVRRGSNASPAERRRLREIQEEVRGLREAREGVAADAGPREGTPVNYTKGQNPILSNFAELPFRFRGREFKTAEGAYQAYKGGGYRPGYENLTGLGAKNKGRGKHTKTVKVDGEYWNVDLMREILRQKYMQVPEFRDALNATTGSITHPVGDAFWKRQLPELLEELRGSKVGMGDAGRTIRYATDEPVEGPPGTPASELSEFGDYPADWDHLLTPEEIQERLAFEGGDAARFGDEYGSGMAELPPRQEGPPGTPEGWWHGLEYEDAAGRSHIAGDMRSEFGDYPADWDHLLEPDDLAERLRGHPDEAGIHEQWKAAGVGPPGTAELPELTPYDRFTMGEITREEMMEASAVQELERTGRGDGFQFLDPSEIREFFERHSAEWEPEVVSLWMRYFDEGVESAEDAARLRLDEQEYESGRLEAEETLPAAEVPEIVGTGRADDFYKDIPLAERTPEQWTSPRRLEAWQMRQDGATYREIGERFGFSQERARRVVKDAERDFAYRDEYLGAVTEPPAPPAAPVNRNPRTQKIQEFEQTGGGGGHEFLDDDEIKAVIEEYGDSWSPDVKAGWVDEIESEELALKADRVEKVKRFSVKSVRAEPDKVFVFADNLKRRGKGGQAIIRGEDNAFGIPTKNDSHMREDAFWSDDLYDTHVEIIDAAFDDLAAFAGPKTVVFPKDGIGTGRAQLRQRAPRLLAYIDKKIEDFAKATEVADDFWTVGPSDPTDATAVARFDAWHRRNHRANTPPTAGEAGYPALGTDWGRDLTGEAAATPQGWWTEEGWKQNPEYTRLELATDPKFSRTNADALREFQETGNQKAADELRLLIETGRLDPDGLYAASPRRRFDWRFHESGDPIINPRTGEWSTHSWYELEDPRPTNLGRESGGFVGPVNFDESRWPLSYAERLQMTELEQFKRTGWPTPEVNLHPEALARMDRYWNVPSSGGKQLKDSYTAAPIGSPGSVRTLSDEEILAIVDEHGWKWGDVAVKRVREIVERRAGRSGGWEVDWSAGQRWSSFGNTAQQSPDVRWAVTIIGNERFKINPKTGELVPHPYAGHDIPDSE